MGASRRFRGLFGEEGRRRGFWALGGRISTQDASILCDASVISRIADSGVERFSTRQLFERPARALRGVRDASSQIHAAERSVFIVLLGLIDLPTRPALVLCRHFYIEDKYKEKIST